MGVVFKFFLPFILLFCFQAVYGIDITKKEIETCLTGEYNRGVNFNIGVSAAGGIELNKIFKFTSGISCGKSADTSEINLFFGSRYSPFSKIPLGISLLYIYNGLPEYKAHTHSILPYIFFNHLRFGISTGVNFRFTSFLDEPAIFEPLISFLTYFNFINNETLRIGISAGNFSEFYGKNTGAYSFCINTGIRLKNNMYLINEMELLQSGVDGFVSIFYGLVLRGGVRFTW